MFYSLPLAIALLGACVRANGQNGVFFLYPFGNETFFSTDVVNVTYTTPFEKPFLILWCNTNEGRGNPKDVYRSVDAPGPNGSFLVPLSNLTKIDSIDTINNCWFNLRIVPDYPANYNGPKGDNSGDAIKIKAADPGRPIVTSSLSPDAPIPTNTVTTPTNLGTLNVPKPTQTTSTGGGTSKETAPAAGSGTSPDNSTSTSTSSNNNSLGTGAIVGLAVGLALLAAIMTGGAGVACWLRRQKRRKAAAAAALAADHEYPYDKNQPPSTGAPTVYTNSPHQSTTSPTSTHGPPQMLSDSYAHGQWAPGGSPPTYHGQPYAEGNPALAQKSSPGTTVSELNSPAGTAELPTRGKHGFGNEHEMAAQEASSHHPSSRGRDGQEKFLLQDVLTTKLSRQPAAELDSTQVTSKPPPAAGAAPAPAPATTTTAATP